MINFKNVKFVKSATSDKDSLYDLPHVIFIGRSNVGKSSLMNALVNSERTIVSDIEGTTRDAINAKFE